LLQAHAQVSDDGVRLKIEKQLHMAPIRPERDSAKFLEADHMEARENKNVVATGNVVLRQLGVTVRADRLDYHDEDQVAIATGNVKVDRDGDIATGPRLEYHLNDDTGEMDSPTFEFPKKPERKSASRGQAERAELETERVSKLFNAEYTSCPIPRDDWFLRVNELTVDSVRNAGAGTHATLYFLGMPIFYTPFLTFPLDNKRKSGFLAPTFGTSGQSGFEASLPYYWNIAQNMDATFTPKIFTKRGEQLGVEFRYLEPKATGQVDAEYMPNDKIAARDRYFFGWRHGQQWWWQGWTSTINAQKVSDDNYFRDLTTKIALTSQTNLPREATLAYNNETWSVTARVLGYQTLQDPGHDVPIPYNILPQIIANGAKQNVAGGFDWQLASELANFKHPVLATGDRFIFYPSISYPFRTSWGYVIPKFGVNYTSYHMDPNTQGFVDATRTLPITSIDSGLFFERTASFGGRSFLQTLEPRLYYLNVPFKDQTDLPNFTTAEADFNFHRLFTENRFVGGDRIGDANQITVALTSRLIESETGLERLNTGLGQVYYFRPPRVSLDGPLTENKTSDIVAYVSSQMAKSFSVDMGLQYTPELNRSEKFYFGTRYAPTPGSILNFAYRYARGTDNPADPSTSTIHQVDLSTQWPILSRWNVLARYNWSIQDHKLLEGLAGFEYNAGCWQVRAVAHRFITGTQTYSTSFQIQLELTGLSRIGINPFETIRQNIPGYRRYDELNQ
jgi:LPS-assembly protein